MISEVSKGVKVTVETFYQQDYSNPQLCEYMFAYRITIENWNRNTIQLIRRRWYIFDSNTEYRDIEGEGVVGVQPVIRPNETYQYISGCNLKSEIGNMYGNYIMRDEVTNEEFEVKIPKFELFVPQKLN